MDKIPTIIIPRKHSALALDPMEAAAEEAAHNDFIPIRIKCPGCGKIFSLYIKDFNQGLYVILGQACSFCKRFITERDDPETLLVDLKEIRENLNKENNNARNSR